MQPTPVASRKKGVLTGECVAGDRSRMGKSGHPRGSKPWSSSSAGAASRGHVEELPRDNHQGSERHKVPP